MSATITFRASPTMNKDLATLTGPMMTALVLRGETIAKRHCPVDTGNLRRSIQGLTMLVNGLIIGIVAATAFYAAFVEFGTKYAQPQPFLRIVLVEIFR